MKLKDIPGLIFILSPAIAIVFALVAVSLSFNKCCNIVDKRGLKSITSDIWNGSGK